MGLETSNAEVPNPQAMYADTIKGNQNIITLLDEYLEAAQVATDLSGFPERTARIEQELKATEGVNYYDGMVADMLEHRKNDPDRQGSDAADQDLAA